MQATAMSRYPSMFLMGRPLRLFLALLTALMALAALGAGAQAQLVPATPCPAVFQYAAVGGGWRGHIRVRPPPPGVPLRLRVQLFLPAALPSNYAGRIAMMENKDIIAQQLLAGSKEVIQYEIYFPLKYPLPRVDRIIVNQDIVCEGPRITGQILTRISLEHTLYPTVTPLHVGPNSVVPTGPSIDAHLGEQVTRPNYWTRPQVPSQQPQQIPWQMNPYYRPQQTWIPPQPQPQQQYIPTSTHVWERPPQNIPQFQTQPPQNIPQFQTQPPQNIPQFQTQPPQNIPQFQTQQPTPKPPPLEVVYEILPPEPQMITKPPVQPKPQLVPQEIIYQIMQPQPHTHTKPSITTLKPVHQEFDTRDICGRSAVANELVLNGKKTSRGEWPWITAIFLSLTIGNLEFQCSGTLINKKHVITAGHCVRPHGQPAVQAHQLVVYLGTYNLRRIADTNIQPREVEQTFVHPDHGKSRNFDADLSVLRLSLNAHYTQYVRPICLWQGSENLQSVIGRLGTVVGWGRDELGNKTTLEPRRTELPIVSQEDCLLSQPDFISITSKRTFCAGFRNDTGPCNGDSGSGLVLRMYDGVVFRWYLRGITSVSLYDRQQNRCDLQNYIVFTDVAKFVPWLQQFMKDEYM